MKNIMKMALGVLTSVGGFLEIGSISTSLQAGAKFRFQLIWAIVLGTICLSFLVEMSGRLAAVSRHSLTDAIREHFGIHFHLVPLTAHVLLDALVLLAEIGGVSLALQLATGISFQVWAVPVGFAIWLLLWKGTFSVIENGVALLGLVTLAFIVGAVRLHPAVYDVLKGVIPSLPSDDHAQYLFLAVSIIGATVSPYLVSFYSSGAVEEKWDEKSIGANRIVAIFGMGFGASISIAVLVCSALVFHPRGILLDRFDPAGLVLTPMLPKWGFTLFVASVAIGSFGAALEIALDVSYIISQAFGWKWGEDQKPHEDARFALLYTLLIPICSAVIAFGADPLKVTMLSMALTVVVLPFVVFPMMVILNDDRYMKEHTNGRISNFAVAGILFLGFVLAIVAIPVQLLGGS